MATQNNKKYYYLKLKENFFDSEEIKLLEASENGYLYSNILLKMYLASLKSEGRLMLRNTIPYNPKMLCAITGHNIDIIKQAISIFREFGLIRILDDGAIYMMDIQSFIGKSSTEADRIREFRNKIGDGLQVIEKQGDVQSSYKCTTEIELELEKDIIYRDLEPEKTPALSSVKQKTRLYDGHSINEYYEIVPKAYNVIFADKPNISKCRSLNNNRKRLIKARLCDELQNIPAWRKYFEWVLQSDFLINECKAVNFDWLLQPRIITNILEGKYHEGRGYHQEDINIYEKE